METFISLADLKAIGISRDAGNDRSLAVCFNRPPTDDELRAFHDLMTRSAVACPFCSKPTFTMPCSRCGEPDMPEAF